MSDTVRPTIVTLQVETLPLADVILCDDAGAEMVMIERKSLRDLASSITDGRYKEQKFRIQQANIPRCIYLIEGDLEFDFFVKFLY